MNFENVVAPIAAIVDGQEAHSGSGFLIRIDSQVYLATVAHTPNYLLSPTADWPTWADKLLLIDEAVTDGGKLQTEAELDLFYEGHKGKRVPRFKYSLRMDRPGDIQDIILLPLSADDPMVKKFICFELPKDRGAFTPSAEVTMLGRRNEFPALSVAKHTLTFEAGPARYMVPEGEEGDSGGPVVSDDGRLLGMNIGSHKAVPGQAMLISTEAIESVAKAVRGVAKDWPTV